MTSKWRFWACTAVSRRCRYYLDSLAWEEAQQTESVTDFLNLFNHRFVALLHRIWRKYRYYISFEPDGRDPFSRYMFTLLGLGSESNRSRIRINHNKMLAYAGLLASRALSGCGVQPDFPLF